MPDICPVCCKGDMEVVRSTAGVWSARTVDHIPCVRSLMQDRSERLGRITAFVEERRRKLVGVTEWFPSRGGPGHRLASDIAECDAALADLAALGEGS